MEMKKVKLIKRLFTNEEIIAIDNRNRELEEENRNLKKEKWNIRQKLVVLEKKLETLSRVKENKELREENKKLKEFKIKREETVFYFKALTERVEPINSKEAEEFQKAKKLFEKLYREELHYLEEENRNLKKENEELKEYKSMYEWLC